MARDHKRQAPDNNWTTAGQSMARDHKRDEAITQNSTNNYHSRSPRSRFFSAPVIFKISARLSSGPPARRAPPSPSEVPLRLRHSLAEPGETRWESMDSLAEPGHANVCNQCLV